MVYFGFEWKSFQRDTFQMGLGLPGPVALDMVGYFGVVVDVAADGGVLDIET
jgi:hypothetical protein